MKKINPKGTELKAPTKEWGDKCGCSVPSVEYMTILMHGQG